MSSTSSQSASRKNVTKVSQIEREQLKDAFILLNTDQKFRFPGKRDDKPFVGDVTYWFKQDEIHQATHVHGGPAFLTWHRELCNRFERFLIMAHGNVSLHYWDWNEDPEDTVDSDGKKLNLFNNNFMGRSHGPAGEPWLSAGFYNPYPTEHNYRAIDPFDIEHSNPAYPPIVLTRQKQKGTLEEYMKSQDVPFYTDKEIIESVTYSEMRRRLERVHNWAHNYIGGTIGDPHTSFRDPFVFLLHSNVDRLFSAWQLCKGFEWRLEPEKVYGEEKNSIALGSTSPYVIVGIRTMLSPWCGVGYPYEFRRETEQGKTEEPGVSDVRPWAFPENWHRNPKLYHYEEPKNSLHNSIVRPSSYDIFPNIAGVEYNNYDLAGG